MSGPDLAALAALPELRGAVAAPDGERVAFYRDRQDGTALCVLEVGTGECTVLAADAVPETPDTHLAWTPGGDAVLYQYSPDPDRADDIHAVGLDGTVRRVVARDGRCLLTDVNERRRRLLVLDWATGGGDLYRHDFDTGETTAVPVEGSVLGAKFAPDGERVACTVSAGGAEHVVAGPVDDPERVTLALDGDDGVGIRDWAAGRLLVEGPSTGRPSCGIVAVSGGNSGPVSLGSPRWVGRADRREHPLQFLDSGVVLAERWTRRATLVPVVYDREGTGNAVPLDGGVADFAGEGYGAALADGRLLANREMPRRRRTVYAWHPDAGDCTPLVDPDDGAVDPEALVGAEHVTVAAPDGARVGAVLYDPDTGGQSPAVLRVSATPRRMSPQSFDPVAQFLAGNGYVVLLVNQRGANDYLGPDHPPLRGALGEGDQADIAAAADWLARRDGVDGDRIGVLGRRYGGYSAVTQLLGHPERYACGVVVDGIADLTALSDDSDADPAVRASLADLLPGDPGSEAWRERSPVTHAAALRAPLAVVHSGAGAAIPVDQARRLRGALRAADHAGTVEYSELDSPDAWLAGHRLACDFLDRHL
jgi:dipeptidyl aminopeptidase/acylaminoacyl peptidase